MEINGWVFPLAVDFASMQLLFRVKHLNKLLPHLLCAVAVCNHLKKGFILIIVSYECFDRCRTHPDKQNAIVKVQMKTMKG